MRRYLLLFIISSLNIFAGYGQNNISITYNMSHRQVEEIQKPENDIMVLDISNEQSIFYCLTFERSRVVTDSLLKTGHNAYEAHEEVIKRNLTDYSTAMSVLKNFPEKGKIVVSDVFFKPFMYEEDMPKMKWTLEEADTTIAGYTCYKAVTTYRGRTWTAFYTPEISIADGPWKLCGLPGMILYARDAKGDFAFDCIGIAKGNQSKIGLRDEKYNHCTAKEMEELSMLMRKNPDELLSRVMGIRVLSKKDANGRDIRQKAATACLIETLK